MGMKEYLDKKKESIKKFAENTSRMIEENKQKQMIRDAERVERLEKRATLADKERKAQRKIDQLNDYKSKRFKQNSMQIGQAARGLGSPGFFEDSFFGSPRPKKTTTNKKKKKGKTRKRITTEYW